jgi:hypothetical protein
VGKKAPWQEWERLFWAASELADKRGEALGRVWMVIESQIEDVGLANTLRLAIIGDFLPDIAVYEVEDQVEECEDEEE